MSHSVSAEHDQRRLRAVLDTAPECIKLVDRDGRLLDINRAGLAMIDAPSLEAVRGHSIRPLIVPEHRAAFEGLLRRVFDGEPTQLAFEIVGLKGRRLWMESHGAPLWSDDTRQTIEAAIFITRDVTDRQRLEDELRQAQKMEAIGRLAGGIAHDFNNLLTVIQGQASLLTTTGRLDAQTESSAREILQSAERAASLTRQLLAFSRRQVKQARDVDVAILVNNMATLLERILGEDISLETHILTRRAFAHVDPTMIEQVILNLAVNARDAMPAGGTLALTLERRPRESGPASKEFLCLSVSDTGCGIAEEHINRIFEPFFTTKDVGRGSGLGLATVYGIVQQHDGWVDVQSSPGGSTFRVWLPALPHIRVVADATPSETTVQGGRERVLIVEDEPSVRQLARLVLERYGYRVLEAETGRRALEIWRDVDGEVDLLLTDLVMPEGISGHALAEKLQAMRPVLKVVYMSGYSDDLVHRHAGMPPGASYLQKPFTIPDLARTIRQSLDAPAAM